MSQTSLVLVRTILGAIVMAVLNVLANSTNLQGVFSPSICAVISLLAVAIEGAISEGKATALFGFVRKA